MKELTITLAAVLLLTGCAATQQPSSVPYVYRQSQFRSRLDYLRFCNLYEMIATYNLEGKGPCID